MEERKKRKKCRVGPHFLLVGPKEQYALPVSVKPCMSDVTAASSSYCEIREL